jgi:cytochrome c556
VSVRSRLEALEAQAIPSRDAPDAKRSYARRLMVEHLDRMARLKRGELGPEEAAEVKTANAAFEARLAQMRGEGGLLG